MATDDEVRAFNNVRDKLAETQADLRACIARAERVEKERDAARADLAIMDADARAAFAAIVPGWDSPDALLVEFDRVAGHARAYRELSASWQARAERAEAALGVEQRLHEETATDKERQVARAQEAEIRAMDAEATIQRARATVERWRKADPLGLVGMGNAANELLVALDGKQP